MQELTARLGHKSNDLGRDLLMADAIETRENSSQTDLLVRVPDEEEFRHLADHLPTLCWIADADGWIYWYNRRWHEYCGSTPENMQGWGWKKVHHPDVLPSVVERWKSCIDSGRPFQMVFPLRGADGQYRTFLTKIEPMLDGQGKVRRWFGMNTDVTDLQQKEQQLIEVNSQLEMALDSGAIRGTWVWDIPSDQVRGDSRFARTFSIDPDALRIGVPLSEAVKAIHPDDVHLVEQAISETLRTGAPYSVEYRVKEVSGDYRWIEANGRCEHDESGKPLRFPGVIIDIHRRKLAEESQRKAAAEAEEASRILSSVIDAMPALIFRKDRRGRLVLANQGVLELLGKSWEELNGQPDEYYLDPEFAAQIKANDQHVMESGMPVEVEEKAGYRNGKPRVWLSRKSPFYNATGEIDGIIGTSIEITDRKETEEIRRLMIRELNHRIKNLFAMTMSLIRVTGRTTTDSRELADKLIARLGSLAKAHSLVLPALDAGEPESYVDLRALLETLLAPYEQEHFIELRGPEVAVPSARVSEMALICHELATNAAKYGSLSMPGGALNVHWSKQDERIDVIWMEEGVTSFDFDTQKGFGSKLIESLISSNLNGEIARHWSDEVLTVRLSLMF